MPGDDRCVCCGEYVPEGRQVCAACEGGVTRMSAAQRPGIVCPYYKFDKDGQLVCEAGKLEMLRDKKLQADYINGYCASMNFSHCTMARALTRHYESASKNLDK
jgi:hypothetical protein